MSSEVVLRQLFLGFLFVLGARAADSDFRVDFARKCGEVRRLNGINKGPLVLGGVIDLAAAQRKLGIASTRLHDCQWPYPDVVDFHAVFRNPDADPAVERNYDFALTDDYLQAVARAGGEIVYRLGESIEHGAVKRFVHPPKDPVAWAEACLGIIADYNEGWSHGFRYGIRYWEIWNEPENRPAMWTGTDEDYFRLYCVAAKRIKAKYPALKVGGPATGFVGDLREGALRPAGFVTNFLAVCRRESAPLDFFSWHCYTSDPQELAERARGVRRLLDEAGFKATESHLNEWNYLPSSGWDLLGKSASPEARTAAAQEMAGLAGAAFVSSALIRLQDAPVDVCNFYHGEAGLFGLFSDLGVPNRVFYALEAFGKVARLGGRYSVERQAAARGDLLAARSEDGKRGALLMSRSSNGDEPSELRVLVRGLGKGIRYEVAVLGVQTAWRVEATGTTDGQGTWIRIPLDSPGIALVEFGNE